MVATRGPLALQTGRSLVDILNFVDSDTLVGIVQYLIIHVGIEIPLCPQHFLDTLIAPAWPAMRGKHDLHIITEFIECAVDLL